MSDEKTIIVSKAFIKGLKEARDKAVSETRTEFLYDGNLFVVSYAKYFLDYHASNFHLEPKFKKGQEVSVERHGKGTVIGKDNDKVRVQFDSRVEEFEPIILWTVTNGAKAV